MQCFSNIETLHSAQTYKAECFICLRWMQCFSNIVYDLTTLALNSSNPPCLSVCLPFSINHPSLSVSPSNYPPKSSWTIYPFIHLSILTSIHLTISLSFHLSDSLHAYMHNSLYIYIYIYIHVSICRLLSPSLPPFLPPSPCAFQWVITARCVMARAGPSFTPRGGPVDTPSTRLSDLPITKVHFFGFGEQPEVQRKFP